MKTRQPSIKNNFFQIHDNWPSLNSVFFNKQPFQSWLTCNYRISTKQDLWKRSQKIFLYGCRYIYSLERDYIFNVIGNRQRGSIYLHFVNCFFSEDYLVSQFCSSPWLNLDAYGFKLQVYLKLVLSFCNLVTFSEVTVLKICFKGVYDIY